jgi:mannose-6-phosphate isomerase-like protein (cupin superfamily)
MYRDELTVGSERITFALTSEQSGGELAVFNVTIPPGGGPPMLHRHDPFELYRVRRGELAIYVAGDDGAVKRTIARPGTLVPIGAGVEHTIRNESDREAEAVVVFSPGEPMERFARAAGDVGAEGIPALARAHGIETTRSLEDVPNENGQQPFSPAYLTIARFSGDGDRLLDAYREHSKVMSAVGRDHGLILHAGAQTDSGFLIVNLWPSKEGSEGAARDQRRLGVIEQAQIDPDQVRREHHELAHFVVFD